MSYTFDELREMFRDTNRFTLEPLSKKPLDQNPHLPLMKQFRNNINRGLMEYLWDPEIEDSQAYRENLSNEIRIYLVIDNCVANSDGDLTRKIVFFFGLSNGAVFDPPPKTMAPHEDKIVHLLVKTHAFYREKEKRKLEPYRQRLCAIVAAEKKSKIADEKADDTIVADNVDKKAGLEEGTKLFYQLYNLPLFDQSMNLSPEQRRIHFDMQVIRKENEDSMRYAEYTIYEKIEKVYNEEQLERIWSISNYYKQAYDDRKVFTKEDNTTSRLVEKTYPAVLLTHFVKNTAYTSEDFNMEKDGFKYKLGDFVFWEILLEKLREIRELSGLSYIYLLAAESYTGGDPLKEADEDRKETEEGKSVVRKYQEVDLNLLAYYRRHFNFQFLNKVIDKQQYDFGCFSMLQTLENIEQYKELMWDSLT